MLTLSSLLDCPACDTAFDAVWNVPDAETPDEVAEAPEHEQTCPACDHTWVAEYPGWSFTNEA